MFLPVFRVAAGDQRTPAYPLYYPLYDSLQIVVACRPETQITRLRERDGLSEVQAQARVDAQMKIEDKVKLADYVLENEEGDMARLESKVAEIFREIARDGWDGQVWGRWAARMLFVTMTAIAYAAIRTFLTR